MTSPTQRKTIAAVLGIQLLLTGCGASAQPQYGSQNWAQPKPFSRNQPTSMQPNFQAPSATHCSRPIETRETPGIVAQHNRPAPAWPEYRSESSRGSARDDERSASRKSSDGPAPAHDAAAVGSVKSAAPAAAAPSVAMTEGRAGTGALEPEALADRSRRESYLPAPFAPPRLPTQQPERPRMEAVTAGMVDDNADFTSYLAFRNRTRVEHRPRDIRERYLLEVKDARGRGVADAEVAVQSPRGQAMWARTDTAGHVWLHPDAFDSQHSAVYDVSVRKDGRQAQGYLKRGQKSSVEVVLDARSPARRAQLDLVFLIDATGSMADEIGKLKATLQTIATDVAQLPSRPDLCFGLVAYRDRTDQFLVRSHDLTNDLNAFQGVLNALQAAGGGDYPEAMNEALHETVHNLSWRGDGATRMVVLIADAPPHLDYGGPQYDDDMMAALGKGIKVFSVGASGLDKQGEYIQRQIAQYTGGRFVFLTYDQAQNPASGPGRETVHDVKNYSVDTLDRLIVRLVGDELGKLAQAQ
jgi:Mg-chelatase subunit ChlD